MIDPAELLASVDADWRHLDEAADLAIIAWDQGVATMEDVVIASAFAEGARVAAIRLRVQLSRLLHPSSQSADTPPGRTGATEPGGPPWRA